MTYRAQMNDRGVITRYKDIDSGETISAKEYERRQQMQHSAQFITPGLPQMTAAGQGSGVGGPSGVYPSQYLSPVGNQELVPPPPTTAPLGAAPTAMPAPMAQPVAPMAPATPIASAAPAMPAPVSSAANPLIQQGAQMLSAAPAPTAGQPASEAAGQAPGVQGKNGIGPIDGRGGRAGEPGRRYRKHR